MQNTVCSIQRIDRRVEAHYTYPRRDVVSGIVDELGEDEAGRLLGSQCEERDSPRETTAQGDDASEDSNGGEVSLRETKCKGKDSQGHVDEVRIPALSIAIVRY